MLLQNTIDGKLTEDEVFELFDSRLDKELIALLSLDRVSLLKRIAEIKIKNEYLEKKLIDVMAYQNTLTQSLLQVCNLSGYDVSKLEDLPLIVKEEN